MLLLAVDTSGRDGSLALARATPGQSAVDVLEMVALAGGAFSAELVPHIAALLAKHGHRPGDLEGFAVVSGPGSFTGLRVGLAAIKGLAEALCQPIATISLLEAVASSSTAGGIVPVLDAGRGDFYVGVEACSPEDGVAGAIRHERLLSQAEFVERAFRGPRCRVVTPDASVANALAQSGLTVELIPRPNSGLVAHLGWKRLQQGQVVSPAELDAHYLRRSDAEIFSKPA